MFYCQVDTNSNINVKGKLYFVHNNALSIRIMFLCEPFSNIY